MPCDSSSMQRLLNLPFFNYAKRHWKLMALLLTLLIGVVTIYQYSERSRPAFVRCKPKAVRQISFVHDVYGPLTHENYFNEWMGYRVPLCENGFRCRWATHPSQADALLFHASKLHKVALGKWKSQRNFAQKWIFFAWESPFNDFVKSTSEWRHVFNWTATYMKSSDIRTPYGGGYFRYKRTKTPIPSVPQATISRITNKRHMMFAVMSNCKAKYRQNIIEKLRRHFPVHVYGKCGRPLPLGYWYVRNLSKRYFFYLAVENTVCQDYITETFWKNGLRGDAIPVVFGGLSRKDYEQDAPPNSFIYGPGFRDISQLAAFMKHLARHPHEYVKYMKWKKTYGLDKRSMAYRAMCNICQRLHTDCTPSTVDLNVAWNSASFCTRDSERTLW